jgi:pimeloyl-ACP methyl ester carboxylesterase
LALALIGVASSGGLASANNPEPGVVGAKKDDLLPVREFFHPLAFGRPALNPSGSRLAAVFNNGFGAWSLAIVNLHTGKTRYLDGGEWFDWLKDDEIVYTCYGRMLVAWLGDVDASERESSKAPATGVVYSNFKRFTMGWVIGIPRTRRGPPAAWFQLNRGQPPVELILQNGDFVSEPSAPDEGTAESYLCDKDGDLAFAFTVKQGKALLFRRSEDSWVKCPVDLERYAFACVGDQPGEIVVLGPRQDGRSRVLQRMDAVTGRPGDVIYTDTDNNFCIGLPFRSRATGRILGFPVFNSGRSVIWLDPKYAALQQRLERSLRGKTVCILNSDVAERRYVIGYDSDRDPGGYYLWDPDKNSMRLLHKAAPWIKPEKMRPMRVISYLSRDGVPIEAYLTLPVPTASGEPPPLVVMPHGGPFERTVFGYSADVQLLATRGYAVLQPNYRGSVGYEGRFAPEDRWNFRKMSDDVTDGVKYVEKLGLIDPERVAILGEGFGGYLALCGVTSEPALYRCVVSANGIFDWRQLIEESRLDARGDSSECDILCRHLGKPASDPKKFDEMSPLGKIGRVRSPVLVYHDWAEANPDYHVRDQSDTLMAALRSNHVPYQEVERYHDKSVWVQEKEFTAILEFLAKNLGRAPAVKDGDPAAVTVGPK